MSASSGPRETVRTASVADRIALGERLACQYEARGLFMTAFQIRQAIRDFCVARAGAAVVDTENEGK